MPEVENLILPDLKGHNIEEHFHKIAKENVEPYQKLIASIITKEVPEMPQVMIFLFKIFDLS